MKRRGPRDIAAGWAGMRPRALADEISGAFLGQASQVSDLQISAWSAIDATAEVSARPASAELKCGSGDLVGQRVVLSSRSCGDVQPGVAGPLRYGG